MQPHSLVAGEVISRRDWTDTEFSLVVKAQVDPFIAGQFTKLALPNAQTEWVRRAYSIVNPPQPEQAEQEMEFLLVTVPEGELSPKLNQLQKGDSVYVGQHPSGFMTASEIRDDAKDVWLLATGTGIGPYIAMLQDGLHGYNNIVLVHAVRHEADLVYRDAIRSLQHCYGERLRYIPIVSREDVPGCLQGRIPELVANGELEHMAGINLHDLSFLYLCGNPQMIRETGQILKNRGLKKHLRRKPGHFSYENYW